ncbi:MAG: NAD-dependent epimerase/dehydratase family protein [Polyangiaceae bacterium]
MRIFVAGASGYIGAAVSRSLIARGHQVVGSARNDATAEKLKAVGIEPVQADLSDADSFGRAAKGVDAVVQAASPNDATSAAVESKAVQAILTALAGSDKPFVLTSGVWVYGPAGDKPSTEESPLNPFAMVAWRPAVEQSVLKAEKIKGIVIRPGMVYGHAGGLTNVFVGQSNSIGRVRVPGDGRNRWSVVHVDDLGELYALALEKSAAGGIYNGSTDESISLSQIGRAIAKTAGVPFGAWPLEEARKELGPLADALAMDQQVRSPWSREILGWAPKQITFAKDLEGGSYT